MSDLAKNIVLVVDRIKDMCSSSDADSVMFAEIFAEDLAEALRDEDIDYSAPIFEGLGDIQKKTILSFYYLQKWSEASKSDMEYIAHVLDWGLDAIHDFDGFGTESQCDPRGDFRIKKWTMRNVDGGFKVSRCVKNAA